MSNVESKPGSMLLVEEYFSRSDDRFLREIRRVNQAPSLAAFTEKWKRDRRPWARQQQIEYLRLPFDESGHEPVVKRLCKHARFVGDDELMAVFLVTFDRMVRRRRRDRTRYDWQTRTSWKETKLELPQNRLPPNQPSRKRAHEVPNPFRRGQMMQVPGIGVEKRRLFSNRTRYYLRRLAARYFRYLGEFHPERYVSAVCRALSQYADDDLAQGEHVLECWGLLQIAFRYCPILEFGPCRVKVRLGATLGNLSPAPRYRELWREPSAGSALLDLILTAASRLVRQWALQLLRVDHAKQLGSLDIGTIFALLNHREEDVQQLGAEVLLGSNQAGLLGVDDWLRLLQIDNPTVLASICEAMQKHVTSERLSLEQCVKIAAAAPVPVSRLGMRFLQGRRIAAREDRQAVVGISGAKCEATAALLAAWALQWFMSTETYDRELVMPFFDSLSLGIRSGAWRWLVEKSPAYHDPVVWVRLTETPFDDIRAQVVAELRRRASLPGISAEDLAPVWSSVLLNVHRGGRSKPQAAYQIAAAIAARPERAGLLLPILVAALRSVRAAEMRTGLAAVLRLVHERPELEDKIRQALPELDIGREEVAR